VPLQNPPYPENLVLATVVDFESRLPRYLFDLRELPVMFSVILLLQVPYRCRSVLTVSRSVVDPNPDP
jgi:hypothetical protein